MKIWRALRMLTKRAGSCNSREASVVFAVVNRHPTRVALYAAAFHAGWKVRFMNSLDAVLEAARIHRPKAVFYGEATGDATWTDCCSTLVDQGIPFILLAHRMRDETFLDLLAAGGYWADPLNSDEAVKAVALAEEVSMLSHAPVQ